MLNKILSKIQAGLKAPKGQLNKFGNYHYRSCEDIVEAVKPLLHGEDVALLMSDEIVQVGTRIYVKATVTISHGESNISVTAYAREAEDKKGMDDSQITGAASSYARKYALNGLFAIDDTKDADTDEHKAVTGDSSKGKTPAVEPEMGGSTPPTPTKDGDTVILYIEEIKRKEGINAKTKKPWASWTLKVGNSKWGTFSKTIARDAEKAKAIGKPVEVVFTTKEFVLGKSSNEIVSLRIMDEAIEK